MNCVECKGDIDTDLTINVPYQTCSGRSGEEPAFPCKRCGRLYREKTGEPMFNYSGDLWFYDSEAGEPYTEEKPETRGDHPYPLPEGMTDDELKSIGLDQGPWRRSPDFICGRCGHAAYYHPYTSGTWGCKKCEFITFSPAVFFKPVM